MQARFLWDSTPQATEGGRHDRNVARHFHAAGADGCVLLKRSLVLTVILMGLSGCELMQLESGRPEPEPIAVAAPPPVVLPVAMTPPKLGPEPAGPIQVGTASWYGANHHGRRTASGERFHRAAYTAAHPTLPFGSEARVTNLANGRSVIVTIQDRGPRTRDRIIDISEGAAEALEMRRAGITRVQVEPLPFEKPSAVPVSAPAATAVKPQPARGRTRASR